MTGQLTMDDALVEMAVRCDPQDRDVVQQAILAVADRGAPFSSNDVRPLLPVLVSNNIGPHFTALKKAKLIKRYQREYVPSTAPSTNGHPVAVWIKETP